MTITLVVATRADRPTIDRLLQLYEYDFSEIGGVDVDNCGLYATQDTGTLWGRDSHAFFINIEGKLAGFAFVTRHDSYVGEGQTHLLSEFFVMRKYRRQGVGEHVAHTLFERFPGRWELGTTRTNLAAQTFWRRVLRRYTIGYQEIADGCEHWHGPIWTFVNSRTL